MVADRAQSDRASTRRARNHRWQWFREISAWHLAQHSMRYTDKRTAVYDIASSSLLDANVSITLSSAHHDQANQIYQHSGGRPKPRLGFLHGETRVHDHHRSAL